MSEIIDIIILWFKTDDNDTWKVLVQTSRGQKRKLSCYRSKKKNEPTKRKNFKQNYVKVSYASDSDDDCLDVEHDSYDEGPSSPHVMTLMKMMGMKYCKITYVMTVYPVEKIVLYNNAWLNFWIIISWNHC